MCRLLGWAAARPTPVADVLTGGELAAFTALSRQHADGWGAAHWGGAGGGDRGPAVQRSTACAADDPAFAELTTGVAADAGLVHLRWATPGLTVLPVNTHPFTRGPLALAHNGAIHPQERLDEILPPGWRARLRGTTDSERYFLAIVARLEGGDSIRDAVASVVANIFATFAPASLNAMLLGSDALYAIRAHGDGLVPGIDPASGRRLSPAESGVAFYDIHYRRSAASVVVASSGFPQQKEQGWELLGNMNLLRIERGTLRVSVTSLVS